MSVILRVRTWQCQLHWDSCEGIYWKQRCLEIQVTVHHKLKLAPAPSIKITFILV